MFDLVDAPKDLVLFAASDHYGRLITGETTSYDDFLYERLAIYEEIMRRPYVMGRDLVEAGLTPDVHFSEWLAYAHKLRLSGVEKEDALKQTLAFARKSKKTGKRK